MGNRWRAICLCCVDTAVIAMAVLGGVIGIATLVTGLTPSVRFCTFVELYPNPYARSKHYWPLEVVNSATPSPSPSIGDVTAWDVRDLSGFYIPDERTDTWSLRCDLGDIHLVHHWRYATLLSSVTDDLSYDERVSTPGWIPASLLLGLTLIVVALRWKYARGAANADATQHALGDRATPRTCRSRLCRTVLGAVLALGVFTGLAVLATLILAELRVGVTIDLPERIPHLLYARTGVNARDGSVRLHYENETTPGGLMQALPMGTYELPSIAEYSARPAHRGSPNTFAGQLKLAGWIPPVILVPLPAYWLFAPAWRRRWRRGHGRCVGCGYDLRGDVAGRCPECGARRGDDAGRVGDGGGGLANPVDDGGAGSTDREGDGGAA